MNLREPHQYSAILERLARVFWNTNEHFAFVPCTEYLGHLFWEITMAVAVARSTNRSLVLLEPVPSAYRVRNRDVFECDFNCGVLRPKHVRLLMRAVYLYEKIRTALRRRLFRVAQLFRPLKGQEPVERFHRCGIEASEFVMAKVRGTSNYYDLSLLPDTEASIRLTPAQRSAAKAALKNSAFDETTWFAAAHVREAGYRGFQGDHDARNFSQQALLPIVTGVLARGGFVVRMGTPEQSQIPRTRGMFDYAASGLQDELLDLFMMESARYYVGSSSGTLSMAYAFGKPALVINYVDLLTAGFRRTDMFIPKTPYDPQTHQAVSLTEYCCRATATWDTRSWWFLEDELEDIDPALEDFMKYVERGFQLTGEDRDVYAEWSQLREKTLRRIIASPAADDFSARFKDVAVSTLGAPAVLAPSFLKKYLFAK